MSDNDAGAPPTSSVPNTPIVAQRDTSSAPSSDTSAPPATFQARRGPGRPRKNALADQVPGVAGQALGMMRQMSGPLSQVNPIPLNPVGTGTPSLATSAIGASSSAMMGNPLGGADMWGMQKYMMKQKVKKYAKKYFEKEAQRYLEPGEDDSYAASAPVPSQPPPPVTPTPPNTPYNDVLQKGSKLAQILGYR